MKNILIIGGSHLIYDGLLIKKNLGFDYETIMSGMRKTYDWYCQNLNEENSKRRQHG